MHDLEINRLFGALTYFNWLGDMDSNHDTGFQRAVSYR